MLEFDGIGTVANAKHPWLGYTQSCIQQKQPVEFDGFEYTWLHALFTGLYCGVPNPSKSGHNQEKDFGEFGNL